MKDNYIINTASIQSVIGVITSNIIEDLNINKSSISFSEVEKIIGSMNFILKDNEIMILNKITKNDIKAYTSKYNLDNLTDYFCGIILANEKIANDGLKEDIKNTFSNYENWKKKCTSRQKSLEKYFNSTEETKDNSDFKDKEISEILNQLDLADNKFKKLFDELSLESENLFSNIINSFKDKNSDEGFKALNEAIKNLDINDFIKIINKFSKSFNNTGIKFIIPIINAAKKKGKLSDLVELIDNIIIKINDIIKNKDSMDIIKHIAIELNKAANQVRNLLLAENSSFKIEKPIIELIKEIKKEDTLSMKQLIDRLEKQKQPKEDCLIEIKEMDDKINKIKDDLIEISNKFKASKDPMSKEIGIKLAEDLNPIYSSLDYLSSLIEGDEIYLPELEDIKKDLTSALKIFQKAFNKDLKQQDLIPTWDQVKYYFDEYHYELLLNIEVMENDNIDIEGVYNDIINKIFINGLEDIKFDPKKSKANKLRNKMKNIISLNEEEKPQEKIETTSSNKDDRFEDKVEDVVGSLDPTASAVTETIVTTPSTSFNNVEPKIILHYPARKMSDADMKKYIDYFNVGSPNPKTKEEWQHYVVSKGEKIENLPNFIEGAENQASLIPCLPLMDKALVRLKTNLTNDPTLSNDKKILSKIGREIKKFGNNPKNTNAQFKEFVIGDIAKLENIIVGMAFEEDKVETDEDEIKEEEVKAE